MPEENVAPPHFFNLLVGALLGFALISGLFYAANRSNVEDSQAVVATLGALPSFTCGVSTIQDADANVYNTVQTGTQC